MLFETTLKRAAETAERLPTDAYADYQQRVAHWLIDHFQARDIEFVAGYQPHIKAMIPAPGLQTHCDVSGMWNVDAVSYKRRDGQEPVPPRENGFVVIYFIQKVTRSTDRYLIDKIGLNLSNNLPFPEGVEYDGHGIYRFESEKGLIRADCVTSGKGIFRRKNEGETAEEREMDELELSISLNQRSATWIKFPAEVLGRGVLTSFFEEWGYMGLDKLVEESTTMDAKPTTGERV